MHPLLALGITLGSLVAAGMIVVIMLDLVSRPKKREIDQQKR